MPSCFNPYTYANRDSYCNADVGSDIKHDSDIGAADATVAGKTMDPCTSETLSSGFGHRGDVTQWASNSAESDGDDLASTKLSWELDIVPCM